MKLVNPSMVVELLVAGQITVNGVNISGVSDSGEDSFYNLNNGYGATTGSGINGNYVSSHCNRNGNCGIQMDLGLDHVRVA